MFIKFQDFSRTGHLSILDRHTWLVATELDGTEYAHHHHTKFYRAELLWIFP